MSIRDRVRSFVDLGARRWLAAEPLQGTEMSHLSRLDATGIIGIFHRLAFEYAARGESSGVLFKAHLPRAFHEAERLSPGRIGQQPVNEGQRLLHMVLGPEGRSTLRQTTGSRSPVAARSGFGP